MTTMEFEDLLRAHALDALLPHEHERLLVLANDSTSGGGNDDHADENRAARLAEVDAVLAAFTAERELCAAVSTVDEPFLANDPTLQQLTATAARAEHDLRARLEHPVPVQGTAGKGADYGGRMLAWRRPVGLALLAAAAAVAFWLAGAFEAGSPRLEGGTPQDLRAGASLQLVLLQPTLTTDARTISWGAVPGASGYHASILDRTGAIVLERDPALLRSTAWELTASDYEAVLPHRPLRLRVTALDGLELPIGSSGDLELTLR